MFEDKDLIAPVMDALLADVEERLRDREHPAPPGLVSLMPGNTAVWDNCCAPADAPEGTVGGQLWVRLISIVPLPQGNQSCDVSMNQLRLGVGIVRCMHGQSEERSPSAEELTGDTHFTTRDATIMQNAIRCFESPDVNKKSMRFEQGVPLGPQGFCGGFEWTITMQVGVSGGCR